MSKDNIVARSALFVVGLFIMAFGVALSVRANLGVSPISCIPYIYCLKFPLSMGMLTILFNVLLILLQIVVKRRNYQLAQLVQFPVVITFGLFTDLTLYLVRDLHPATYPLQLLLCLASCVVIAFGVFIEVKAKVTYLAGEGLAMALSETFHFEFGKAKMATDCTMVLGGLVSSFIFLHELKGIREGTIIAALLVGFLARIYCRRLTFLDGFQPATVTPAAALPTPAIPPLEGKHLVITISREFGSGGREIGKRLAEKLGLAFFDKEIIRLTAEESGFTPEYIAEHEQRLAHSLLHRLYENYAYMDEQMPPLDALFLVQSKIIREISEQQACVIVGRCADFVLKNRPHCFKLFIHANPEFRKQRYIQDHHCDSDTAEKELAQINHDRASYRKFFTGKDRGQAVDYDLTIDSSAFGIEKTADLIVSLLKQAHLDA